MMTYMWCHWVGIKELNSLSHDLSMGREVRLTFKLKVWLVAVDAARHSRIARHRQKLLFLSALYTKAKDTAGVPTQLSWCFLYKGKGELLPATQCTQPPIRYPHMTKGKVSNGRTPSHLIHLVQSLVSFSMPTHCVNL